MKNVVLVLAIISPMLSNAHSGHEHVTAEIISNPASWLSHPLYIMPFIVLAILVFQKKRIKQLFFNK